MKYKVVIVDDKIIGYINENEVPENYIAEVSLNGPVCFDLTGDYKINTSKNIESASKEDLNFQIIKFIEELLPNIDFKIEKRFKDLP